MCHRIARLTFLSGANFRTVSRQRVTTLVISKGLELESEGASVSSIPPTKSLCHSCVALIWLPPEGFLCLQRRMRVLTAEGGLISTIYIAQ